MKHKRPIETLLLETLRKGPVSPAEANKLGITTNSLRVHILTLRAKKYEIDTIRDLTVRGRPGVYHLIAEPDEASN